jgi:hypothetical protein
MNDNNFVTSSIPSCHFSSNRVVPATFGDRPFLKYSAARTAQFAVCRPASPVRLHYPRFPTG